MDPSVAARAQRDQPVWVVDTRPAMVDMQHLAGATRAATFPVPFENVGAMSAEVLLGIGNVPGADAAHPEAYFERPSARTEESLLKAPPAGKVGLDGEARATRTESSRGHG
ncbi:MAG: hypothetical protein M3Y50_06705 [Acidobacteriota bacterium]|nr:hypothetical protein [Acidobacteriota bacterium]